MSTTTTATAIYEDYLAVLPPLKELLKNKVTPGQVIEFLEKNYPVASFSTGNNANAHLEGFTFKGKMIFGLRDKLFNPETRVETASELKVTVEENDGGLIVSSEHSLAAVTMVLRKADDKPTMKPLGSACMLKPVVERDGSLLDNTKQLLIKKSPNGSLTASPVFGDSQNAGTGDLPSILRSLAMGTAFQTTMRSPRSVVMTSSRRLMP